MMTLEAVGIAMSALLAGACVALLVLAVFVIVRNRRAGAVRLFGREVHRPGLWASAVVCLGVSGLLRLSSIEEVMPSGWWERISWLDGGLTLAFFVLLSIYLISAQRDKRRRDREPRISR